MYDSNVNSTPATPQTATIEVLDPTYGDGDAEFTPAPRLATLTGAAIGIISNGKQGTRPFFDALERELRDGHGVADVVSVTKPNYSAPAGASIMDRTARWHALIAGVGD
jgi:hypothetical protein